MSQRNDEAEASGTSGGDPSEGTRDPLLESLVALIAEIESPPPEASPLSTDDIIAQLDRLGRGDPANQGNPPSHHVADSAPSRSARPSATATFCQDLTEQVKTTPPVHVGREAEIETVIESLCRRRKANPLLLGPPGSGKTALVEAVAVRIAAGTVPAVLQGTRLLALNTAALVAGAGQYGEIEARVKAILEEVSGTNIVLFLDEVHALMGAGGREGTGDVASLLKPALARGEIRCIAATTDDEFHRFIQHDAALERRFLPIRLRPLSARETQVILVALRDADPAGPTCSDAAIDRILDIADRSLPNRQFPDKAIDLFDQVVAFARLRDLAEVSLEAVETVAERMIGVPASPTARIQQLADVLHAEEWCDSTDVEQLQERLSVTLRGLDLHPDRPNLVASIQSETINRLRGFAAVVAQALYGDPTRVLEIDGAGLTESHSISSLVGASAGYVGYDDRHLLHRLAEQPCHVLVINAMETMDPAIRQFLEEAIRSGWAADRRGRRIPLSEAIVLIQRNAAVAPTASIGFVRAGPRETAPAPVHSVKVDLSLSLRQASAVTDALRSIASRWRDNEGVTLHWTPALIAWAGSEAGADTSYIDTAVATPLWRLLRGDAAPAGHRFEVDVAEGRLMVRAL